MIVRLDILSTFRENDARTVVDAVGLSHQNLGRKQRKAKRKVNIEKRMKESTKSNLMKKKRTGVVIETRN
jgi:hypothetical protein